MNYTENAKLLVSVSDDTPSKLSDLKSSIIDRTNHDIPFFMMPVRMETRFMKPMRSILSEAYTSGVILLTGVLTSLSTLIDRVSIFEGFVSETAFAAAGELKELFASAEIEASAISSLKPVEKSDLLRLIGEISVGLSGASSNILSSSSDQFIIDDLNNALLPAINTLKLSIESSVNSASVDNTWLQQTTFDGNNLANFITIKTSTCNSILPTLGFGQGFNNTAFKNLSKELRLIQKELNNFGAEFNVFDRQLVWMRMQNIQVVLNTINAAVISAPPSPQRNANLYFLNKHLAQAWHNFSQADQSSGEWLPIPENRNALLTEEMIASISPTVVSVRDDIDALIVLNEDTLSILESAQGMPNQLLLTSILDNLDQIKVYLSSLSPLPEIETLFLWEKLSVISLEISRTDALIETLSAFDPVAGSAFSDTLSLRGIALTEEWVGISGTTLSLDISNSFSFYSAVNELWIRVYPDDIFIHNLEEGITAKEKISGEEFWKEWWAARGDKAKEIAAWRALIAIYGVTRAAWIIKVLTPTTISSTTTSTKASGVVMKIGVLSSYTTKISGVIASTAPGVSTALPHFLTHYTPHLEYLTDFFAELPHMPASMIAVAADEVSAIKAEFITLGESILLENPQLSTEIGSIETKFATLLSTIENVDSITSWEVSYDAEPTFPNVQVKATTWTSASFTRELPDSFVFATIDTVAPVTTPATPPYYSFKHIKVGNPVPLTLQVGIHPESSVFDLDAFSNLKLDPELKWMFDFDEAVRIGMGITIRLTDDEAKNGFDKVLALGVKLGVTAGVSTSESHNYGKNLVEDLFKNHHYSGDGMSILNIGTPTNNTDNDSAGFKKPDEFGNISFDVELGAPMFSRTLDKFKRKDGQWLADAIGIEYDVLYHIENANKKQISSAIAMNYALWPGTVGNFMSEMMSPLFTKDSIERTKNYFSDYVLGRNTLPTIRVGSQPYGILTTTAYTRWKFPFSDHTSEIPTDYVPSASSHQPYLLSWYNHYDDMVGRSNFFTERFNARMFNVFKVLNNTWLEMAKAYVKTVNNDSKKVVSGQADFMEILGSDALMSEVYSRFMVNSAKFVNIYDNYATTPASSKWSTADINVPAEFYSLLNSLKLHEGISGIGIDHPIFDDVFVQNIMYNGGSGLPASLISKILNDSNSIFNVDLIKGATLSGIDSKGSYLLKGPTVDEKVLSEKDSLTPVGGKNYIEWLLNAPLADVWKNNAFGNMKSRSLLFLLLRQSLLTVYKDTACNTLIKLNEFSSSAIKTIGQSRGIAAQILEQNKQLILTKWHLLFNNRDYLLDVNNGLNLAYQYFRENPKFDSIVSTPKWSSWPDFSAKPPYVTPARPLPTSFSSTYNALSFADFLKSPTPSAYPLYNDNTDWVPIQNMIKGFEGIKDLPTADLDLLLREHVDLASYRLDAWNAGMVNKRLWDNRNTESYFRKKGVYVGAYGWLLEVKPKGNLGLVKVDSADIPKNLKDSGDTVYYDNNSLGFIHTPSISHALTAAILRSGYMSEKNSADNKFAVNLSSERVQLAMSILEGMRNGQSLNALLGYMFERGLHENYPEMLNLNDSITDLRKLFPLEGALTSSALSDSISPNNVTDGIELLHEFKGSIASIIDDNPDKSIIEIYYSVSSVGSATTFGIIPMPANIIERKAIITEIDRIANALDAVADLAIAEGVFQIVKGNAAKSAATMQAYTEGKNPPMPEIVNTPISGTRIAHKLVNFITPVTGSISSPWTGVSLSPRSKAEPSLNKWIADLLYNSFSSTGSLNVANEIGCLVNYQSLDDTTETINISLLDLNIQPIDLVYMIENSEFNSEFKQRIAAFVRKSATDYDFPNVGIPYNIDLNIKLGDKGLLKASFKEITSLLNSASNLIFQSRYLKGEDFSTSANEIVHVGSIPPFFNYSELEARGEELLSNFDSDMKTYFESLPPANNAELNNLKIKLQLAADYGIHFAMPNAILEEYDEESVSTKELLDLFERVKFEVLKRYTTSADLHYSITHTLTSEIEKVAAWDNLFKEILGANFKVIPHFSFDYYIGLETKITDQLTASLTAGSGIMGHHNTSTDDLEDLTEDWIYGLARVQDKVEYLETARMLMNADSAHSLKELMPVQFPYITDDYWLGASYPEAYEPTGDKFSVAILNYSELTTSSSYNYYSGLVLQEWDEIIPDKEVTTGISFNYDQPNAKPPQNALLAVHPGFEGTWTLDDLWFTLLDTIEMAKIRMVEPDHFKKDNLVPGSDKFEIFKYVLPAIVGEVTPHNIVAGDHISYQGTESVQQVSFEYNPNNDKIPSEYIDPLKVPGTPGSPSSFLVREGADWDKLDADSVLTDDSLSDFMLLQDQLSSIADTQREMKKMQEHEEVISNPQQ